MNKVVWVTGSAKGLGLAISERLLQEGYIVVGVSRTETVEYNQLLLENSGKAFFYKFDFMGVENISGLVKELIKKHGRPYGLINNAALGNDGILGTMHEKDINSLIKVNVEAPILLTKYASRSMLLNRTGRIVNVGSIIGSTGFSGLSVYGATKSALSGFTKSLSRELGKAGITVNTLCPGYMKTNMTEGLVDEKLEKIKRRSPMGRLASVEDAANGIVYLLSDSASSVTGIDLTIDAGSTA